MVILLNGSINSGKTTIGNTIAALNIGFAHIEVDYLRHFIDWMPLAESIELNLRNAADVASNFHTKNIDAVISYPLSAADYEFLGGLLRDSGIDFCAVTLFPGLESLKTNRGNRALTDWEVNRIEELYSEGTATPNFGVTINNSELSVSETALEVLKVAGLNKPLQRILKKPLAAE